MADILQQISVGVPAVLAAIILHEVAHGFVAYRLGDPTAQRAGRLTLNPLPHIDPFGTIILPLLLFIVHSPVKLGWARPVPVNFGNLRHPRRDMVLVALAGPLTNIGLALVSAALLHVLLRVDLSATGFGATFGATILRPLALMAYNSVMFNVMLAVFNLLPILPLDGGRVLAGLLPPVPALAYRRLEPYGMLIIVGLLSTDTLDRVIGPVIDLVRRALL